MSGFSFLYEFFVSSYIISFPFLERYEGHPLLKGHIGSVEEGGGCLGQSGEEIGGRSRCECVCLYFDGLREQNGREGRSKCDG